MKLTHEARQAIRQAIDHHKRERLALHRQAVKACTGCGTEFGNYTIGCRTCMNRRGRARLRAMEAENLDRDTRYQRGLCTRCGVHRELVNPECGTCLERARGRRRKRGMAA